MELWPTAPKAVIIPTTAWTLAIRTKGVATPFSEGVPDGQIQGYATPSVDMPAESAIQPEATTPSAACIVVLRTQPEATTPLAASVAATATRPATATPLAASVAATATRPATATPLAAILAVSATLTAMPTPSTAIKAGASRPGLSIPSLAMTAAT
ncbi:hypothetical protein ACLHDG_08125 [Sulfurovum sp. CS9]|uniref:hypothetical protein n=1 Tax=Sulfurovum sp. CS9 TaxID=3391146 RepID=UPI0039E7D307